MTCADCPGAASSPRGLTLSDSALGCACSSLQTQAAPARNSGLRRSRLRTMWSNATYSLPRAASRPRVHKPPSAPACARPRSRQGNPPERHPVRAPRPRRCVQSQPRPRRTARIMHCLTTARCSGGPSKVKIFKDCHRFLRNAARALAEQHAVLRPRGVVLGLGLPAAPRLQIDLSLSLPPSRARSLSLSF